MPLRCRICTLLLGGLILAAPLVADPSELPPTVTGKDGAPMSLIPAGEFLMGTVLSNRDGGRDEYPERRIYLDAFNMDIYEVTNGRYLEFVQATGHRIPEHPRDKKLTLWQGSTVPDAFKDHPVANVDWYDAHYYEKGPNRNPKGPTEGTRKVIRGSGWESEAPLLRSAHRLNSDPRNRNHSLGFRCAMDAVIGSVR